MRNLINKIDAGIIKHLHKLEVPLARIAIFVVYFWFGLLKLIGVSPATPLVETLFNKTISFMSFEFFHTSFAVFEMLIGILFLIKGFERLAIFLIGLHLITTVMPLVFLPSSTWQAFLVPTLEGQYIIKNILIAASAVVVGSTLVPIGRSIQKK
ncbi:MAG: hypothetical protein HYS87_00410 [Candidatus Colwellbacteria bacterium]|nr:hypothetical protein [Candidatus Colwellbacteria bacterium]